MLIENNEGCECPFFSIIIPAYNEVGSIHITVESICKRFADEDICDYEILIVNDNSTDGTETVLNELSDRYGSVWYVTSERPNGFGFAVRYGLSHYRGDAVVVVMGDLSDSPDDIIKYYRLFKQGAECVFGSRFMKESHVYDYPKIKLIVNRLANWFIKFMFRLDYNDVTNAFKGYRREVIDGLRPFLAPHFNLTVELPLKAIVRGYSYEVIPISWTNRTTGESKLLMKEMGSRYLFIVLYVLLEKWLSCGDFDRERYKQSEVQGT